MPDSQVLKIYASRIMRLYKKMGEETKAANVIKLLREKYADDAHTFYTRICTKYNVTPESEYIPPDKSKKARPSRAGKRRMKEKEAVEKANLEENQKIREKVRASVLTPHGVKSVVSPKPKKKPKDRFAQQAGKLRRTLAVEGEYKGLLAPGSPSEPKKKASGSKNPQVMHEKSTKRSKNKDRKRKKGKKRKKGGDSDSDTSSDEGGLSPPLKLDRPNSVNYLSTELDERKQKAEEYKKQRKKKAKELKRLQRDLDTLDAEIEANKKAMDAVELAVKALSEANTLSESTRNLNLKKGEKKVKEKVKKRPKPNLKGGTQWQDDPNSPAPPASQAKPKTASLQSVEPFVDAKLKKKKKVADKQKKEPKGDKSPVPKAVAPGSPERLESAPLPDSSDDSSSDSELSLSDAVDGILGVDSAHITDDDSLSLSNTEDEEEDAPEKKVQPPEDDGPQAELGTYRDVGPNAPPPLAKYSNNSKAFLSLRSVLKSPKIKLMDTLSNKSVRFAGVAAESDDEMEVLPLPSRRIRMPSEVEKVDPRAIEEMHRVSVTQDSIDKDLEVLSPKPALSPRTKKRMEEHKAAFVVDPDEDEIKVDIKQQKRTSVHLTAKELKEFQQKATQRTKELSLRSKLSNRPLIELSCGWDFDKPEMKKRGHRDSMLSRLGSTVSQLKAELLKKNEYRIESMAKGLISSPRAGSQKHEHARQRFLERLGTVKSSGGVVIFFISANDKGVVEATTEQMWQLEQAAKTLGVWDTRLVIYRTVQNPKPQEQIKRIWKRVEVPLEIGLAAAAYLEKDTWKSAKDLVQRITKMGLPAAYITKCLKDEHGDKELLRFLQSGARLDHMDPDHETAKWLFEAAGKGDYRQVRALLSAGACVEHTEKNGYTPLMRAAMHGHTDVVTSLLRAHARLDRQLVNGQTAFHKAAMKGLTKTVNALLANPGGVKYSIDHADKEGKSALLYAVEQGHENSVRVLVQHGASVNISDKHGETALIKACMVGSTAVARTLLEVPGINLEAKPKETDPDVGSVTSLVWAFDFDYKEIVKLLLEKGADANQVTKEGTSVLHWAAGGGYTDIVKLLLANGMKPDLLDENAFTPLILAAHENKEATALVLIKAGAKVNARNSQGETAMIWAASRGSASTVRALLKAKANANIKCRQGYTALDWAESEDHKSVIKLLNKAGAVSGGGNEDGAKNGKRK